ncbi:MAG: hypothetical protein ABIG89_01905 [Candidatus Woesearchaeota archaeon]
MKRKIIKQGESALTVTIPKKWAKDMNILNNKEINCDIRGNELVYSIEKEPEALTKTIDITNMSKRVIRWFLAGMHKGGYDEIEIFYKGEDQLELINELIKDLMMGFAIVEQSEKRVLLRLVTKENPDEFQTLLRRAFLVGLNLSDSCLIYIKTNKFDKLEKLTSLEKTNNQLTNFCERMINKGVLKESNNSHFLYVIVWNLEKIVDDYKYIVQYLSGRKKTISKEVIKLFEKINNHFRAYYELFYTFDSKKMSDLSIYRKETEKEIKKLLEKSKGEESVVISYLHTILMKCEDFSASMFMLKHE